MIHQEWGRERVGQRDREKERERERKRVGEGERSGTDRGKKEQRSETLEF